MSDERRYLMEIAQNLETPAAGEHAPPNGAHSGPDARSRAGMAPRITASAGSTAFRGAHAASPPPTGRKPR